MVPRIKEIKTHIYNDDDNNDHDNRDVNKNCVLEIPKSIVIKMMRMIVQLTENFFLAVQGSGTLPSSNLEETLYKSP